MKKLAVLLCAFALCSRSALAQTVLAVDFNDRSTDPSTVTHAGFNSFLIASNVSATAIQTGALARTFGALTVTVSGSGSNPGYDDRLRTAAQGPPNAGTFDQTLLLRDFIFSQDTASGGLNLTVDGLTPNQVYQATIWSFDSQTTGGRISDWTANGFLVKSGYAFNGSVAPTNNSQYQIAFKIAASPSGQIAIQGRRNSTSPAGFAVFANALQLDVSFPDPPTTVSLSGNTDLFVGDNLFLTATSDGTPPFTYYWFRDSTLVGLISSNVFVLTNVNQQFGTNFSVVISNATGLVQSSPLPITLRDVTNISQGLLAYWPLDSIVFAGGARITADAGPFGNFLYDSGIDTDSIELGTGSRKRAIMFNAADQEYLYRTNYPGDSLPAYGYPAYSVALWVKGNVFTTNEFGQPTNQVDRRVFSEGSNTNNNSLVTIGTDSRTDATQTNVVDIFIRNNSGTAPVNHRRSSLPVFDGNWHHIAWVDNNGFAQLYVDGIRDTNNFNYTRGVLTPNIDALGAVVRTNATAFFHGAMDDAIIYRRSLTSNEIAYIMTYGPFELPGILTRITVASNNVTLKWVDPTGKYSWTIQETAEFLEPSSPSVWTDVTNAALTVDGNMTTAELPQGPGPKRFYRLRRN